MDENAVNEIEGVWLVGAVCANEYVVVKRMCEVDWSDVESVRQSN